MVLSKKCKRKMKKSCPRNVELTNVSIGTGRVKVNGGKFVEGKVKI